jgi:hypothetical protein
LVTAIAAVVVVVPLASGCEAKVYGTPPEPAGPQLTVIAPMGTKAPLPESPPDEPAAIFDGLTARAQQAAAEAAKAGANISAVVLDRNTDQVISSGNAAPTPIASVVKLFIADDLLLQEAKGQTELTPEDRKAFDAMLRSSDDSAARCSYRSSAPSSRRCR